MSTWTEAWRLGVGSTASARSKRKPMLLPVVKFLGKMYGLLAPIFLTVVALVLFVVAAFMIGIIVGLFTAGLCVLILEFRLDGGSRR